MFTDNKDFYPTPKALIHKMWDKIPKKAKYDAKYILEPEAGAGDIVDYLNEFYDRYQKPIIHAIEKDHRLVNILQGKKATVIDRDFLTYCGPDKYDIIIANPPFSNGEHHLLKMIDIMFNGHIVCLLNAETIRNPNTNTRKLLVRKLGRHLADIEFFTEEFVQAERKTNVEIALVYLHIENNIEHSLFEGMSEAKAPNIDPVNEFSTEITEKDSIRNIVADYNRTVAIGTETLLDFYRNAPKIGRYITVKVIDEDSVEAHRSLTAQVKEALNKFLTKVRRVFWNDLINFEIISKRLTSKKRKEFYEMLKTNEHMDFTEENIRTFISNLMKDYDTILTEATVDIFEKLSHEYAYDENIHNGNVHYFDGWKTNKAFFVNHKVIIPYWGEALWDKIMNRWSIRYDIQETLDDIDKVMNSFDGAAEYVSMRSALNKAIAAGQSKGIRSAYFDITIYKKGTVHLTFLSEDIRRRFNVTACRGKNWLPMDYGKKAYSAMTSVEKTIVDQFEGKKAYEANFSNGARLFRSKPSLQIGYTEETQKAA